MEEVEKMEETLKRRIQKQTRSSSWKFRRFLSDVEGSVSESGSEQSESPDNEEFLTVNSIKGNLSYSLHVQIRLSSLSLKGEWWNAMDLNGDNVTNFEFTEIFDSGSHLRNYQSKLCEYSPA
ncbi:Uncharacterized protein Fot_21590 [Forsythia ovata]|uniref:Uncharacterized protein n=1 Tax=Forsythia ovata TaxID=205694 RepID=A0ABD1UV94_9LAMI